MKKLIAATIGSLLLVASILAAYTFQIISSKEDIPQIPVPPQQEVTTQEPIKVPDKTYLAPAAKVEGGGTVIDPNLSPSKSVILG